MQDTEETVIWVEEERLTDEAGQVAFVVPGTNMGFLDQEEQRSFPK